MTSHIQYLVSPINETEEINNFYYIKSQYNNHLKNIYQNKGKKTLQQSIKPLDTRISNVSNNVSEDSYPTFRINTPLVFKEDSNDTHNMLIIESYDDKKIVLRKTIFIKKNLDPIEIKKNINSQIQRSNIINDLKDLMDKIKILNKFKSGERILNSNGDIIPKEKIIEQSDELEKNFESLKQVYNDLFKRRNEIEDKFKIYKSNFDRKLCTINQKEIHKLVEYSKMYINLFDDSDTLDTALFKQYIVIQKELDSLYGINSLLEKGRIVNIMTSDDTNILGIIQEMKSESICMVSPIFTDNIMDVNIEVDDIKDYPKVISNFNIIGLRQQSSIINNNYFPHIVNDVDTKVKMEVFFKGNSYHGNTDYFAEQTETNIELVNRKVLNIDNLQESPLYDINGSVFIIGKDSKPYPPGMFSLEKLVSDDHLSKKYLSLSLHNDWRIKLDNNFVNNNLELVGRVISPIVIDNNMFPSVNHYLNYEKFRNRRKLSGRKRRQFERHANKFRIDPNNPTKYLSNNDLEREGRMYSNPVDWSKTKELLVKKAIYAKFAQNSDLKQILLDTGNSILITKNNTSYLTLDKLMEIRHLLQNDTQPDFYDSQPDIDALEEKNQIIKKYIKKKLDNLRKIDKKTKRFNSILNKNSVTIGLKRTDNSSKKLKEDAKLDYSEPKSKSKDYSKIYGNVLNKYFGRHVVSKMSTMQKEDAQRRLIDFFVNGTSLVSSTKFESIAGILKGKGYNIEEVPPDGDCMYYSIIHGMKYKNVIPMDFRGDDFKYSDKQSVKNVSIEEVSRRPVYRAAVLECRSEIADKMSINFSRPDKNEELKLIEFEIQDLGIKKYIAGVKNSALSGGQWGGFWELTAASALYNINFVIHSDSINKGKQGYTIKINAAQSKTIFPHGKSYNSTISEVPTIVLGYMEGLHYVLGREDELEMAGGSNLEINNNTVDLNEIRVYLKDIKSFNENIYTISAIKIDNNLEILGIINRDTNKIQYSIGENHIDKKIMNDLGTKMKKYLEIMIKNNSLDSLEKIIYWQDKLSNNLYNEDMEKIGKIVNKEDNFTGDSYIELKFD